MEFKVFPNQKAPRMFKSNFLQSLTVSHPVVINVMYSTIAISLMCIFYFEIEQNLPKIILWFFIGFFSWTLGEYLMHRFLYHKIKDASYDTGLQYTLHGIHHQYPNDDGKIVLPPVPSLIIASLFFGLFYVTMGNYAFTFGPGFMLGYTAYQNVHWITHQYAPPKKGIHKYWWEAHNIHHFQQHDRSFGVTSPLWDMVFRTMPEKGRKTVTIKFGKVEDQAKEKVA